MYPSLRPPCAMPGESRSDSTSGEDESATLTDVEGREAWKRSSAAAEPDPATLYAKGYVPEYEELRLGRTEWEWGCELECDGDDDAG
jgi:hypothetical protein